MINLEISTDDQVLIESLTKDVPDGISVFKKGRILATYTPDPTDAIYIGISIQIMALPVTQIILNVLSAWLYDKLKKSGSKKITINSREVYLTEGNITKIIEETIQIEE